jgi:transposase
MQKALTQMNIQLANVLSDVSGTTGQAIINAIRISGNKIIGKGRLPTNNRASLALKMAASTLRLSSTYLGAQFRRLRTKLGSPIAIKAMAAKLARLVYRMLRYGMQFVDRGAHFYEAEHRQRQISYLKSKAAKLGFKIIEASAA